MEENRKGPGIFYAVVGVATLVVAIIGATFAFFSASATAGEDVITGGTLDVGGSFSVSVTQLHADTRYASSERLVPADFSRSISSENATLVLKTALEAKCEDATEAAGGYTGCHIWRIDATTGQDLATANLILNLTAPKGENWSYVLFKHSTYLEKLSGTVGTVTLSASNEAIGTFDADGIAVDMHNGASMNGVADTEGNVADGAISETYYLMVYLKNVDTAQNDGETSGTLDETGDYSGTVTFAAAGGEVKASFSVVTPPV